MIPIRSGASSPWRFGGLPHIARRVGVNVTQAYRSLSRHGNPSFRTVHAVLREAGLEISVRLRP
jgi:DNA-binding phage protein